LLKNSPDFVRVKPKPSIALAPESHRVLTVAAHDVAMELGIH
jgi:hypothetical protein